MPHAAPAASCLSEGNQQPILPAALPRQGSGRRGWGHRRCRGGARTAAGSRRRRPRIPAGCAEGDASAARGAAGRGQLRGWCRAAQRGRGGGGTPPPRLFFSRCGRHTPLPAPAAPVLPAPAAIIRRAAGGPGGAEPSLGGQGTLRGSSLGQWGCAGQLSFRRAASQAVRGWCWGGILRSTPRPGGCRHGAIPARVEGEPVQAAAGRGRACPGRSGTPSAGEIPCLLCAFKGAGSSL